MLLDILVQNVVNDHRVLDDGLGGLIPRIVDLHCVLDDRLVGGLIPRVVDLHRVLTFIQCIDMISLQEWYSTHML
jgi:hypothetical protein